MDYAASLEQKFGLKNVQYKYNLSKEELFHEAIANDRGRIRKDGPEDDQKAYPTKLGVDGPRKAWGSLTGAQLGEALVRLALDGVRGVVEATELHEALEG